MEHLAAKLRACLRGRVCLLGLGHPGFGDDALGIRLAEMILRRSASLPAGSWLSPYRLAPEPGGALEAGPSPASRLQVMVAGTEPERWLTRLTLADYDQVLFLDAVEFGATPGSVVLLSAKELTARYPQVSTHRLSLGLLAGWLENQGGVKVHLLGVQPETLRPGAPLSLKVKTTLDILIELLVDLVTLMELEARSGNAAGPAQSTGITTLPAKDHTRPGDGMGRRDQFTSAQSPEPT